MFLSRGFILLLLIQTSHGFLNALTARDPPLNLPRARRRLEQGGCPRLWAKKNKNKEASESFDMKELQQRIHDITNPYHELFGFDTAERPDSVHVILFKPDTDEQGVHTIEYPKESGSNFVLAFESKKACDEFSSSLKAQNFDNLSRREYAFDSLQEFCDMLGVFVQVVPEGISVLPPMQSVQTLGQHDPHLKEEKSHLDYLFDMFELEVDELGLMLTEPGCWE